MLSCENTRKCVEAGTPTKRAMSVSSAAPEALDVCPSMDAFLTARSTMTVRESRSVWTMRRSVNFLMDRQRTTTVRTEGREEEETEFVKANGSFPAFNPKDTSTLISAFGLVLFLAAAMVIASRTVQLGGRKGVEAGYAQKSMHCVVGDQVYY